MRSEQSTQSSIQDAWRKPIAVLAPKFDSSAFRAFHGTSGVRDVENIVNSSSMVTHRLHVSSTALYCAFKALNQHTQVFECNYYNDVALNLVLIFGFVTAPPGSLLPP